MTEKRQVKSAVRAAELDGQPGVTLRLITPGVVDDYGTLWDAHAFDEELDKRLPTLGWAHDWSDPLGPGVSWEASDEGPIVSFRFSDFDAVPSARRAHAQVADGTIQDCSVGFTYLQRREPNEAERKAYSDPPVREVVTRARCDETSLVLRGAVPGAKVLAVRSAHLRGGRVVDIEDVYKVAEDLAGGKITKETALASLDLMAQDDDEAPPVDPEEPAGPTDEELVAAAEALDVEAAEAESIALEALAE